MNNKIPYNALNPDHNDTTKFKINKGSVFQHILACLRSSRSNDPVTNIAILLHDVGKPISYKLRDGHKDTYYNHEELGVSIVDDIGKRLKLSSHDIEILKFCAAKHMLVHKIYELSKSKLAALINHPYWPILKEVSCADEKSRLHLFNQEEFEKKIQYAEDTKTVELWRWT